MTCAGRAAQARSAGQPIAGAVPRRRRRGLPADPADCARQAALDLPHACKSWLSPRSCGPKVDERFGFRSRLPAGGSRRRGAACRRSPLRDAALANGSRHGALHRRLVETVTVPLATGGVAASAGRRKHPLPSEVALRAGSLQASASGSCTHPAPSRNSVACLVGNQPGLPLKRAGHQYREQPSANSGALAASNRQARQVDDLDAQGQGLKQTKSGTAQEGAHKTGPPRKTVETTRQLLTRQPDGHAGGSVRLHNCVQLADRNAAVICPRVRQRVPVPIVLLPRRPRRPVPPGTRSHASS